MGDSIIRPLLLFEKYIKKVLISPKSVTRFKCGNNPVNWIDPWGLEKDDDESIGEKIIDAIEALENSSVGEVLDSMNDGLCAWVDGLIPFGDPLDDTYEGMGFSKGMGMVSQEALITAGGLRGAAWIGGTKYGRTVQIFISA